MSIRFSARALPLALVTALGVTISAPAVQAAPVASPYRCTAPGLPGSLTLDLSLETNIPAKVYVGTSRTPKLVLKTTVPANIVGLATTFGVKSARADGTFTVNVNGKPSARPFVFPRTDMPEQAKALPVTLSIPLPKLSPSAVGTVTYKPGPVAIHLEGFNKKVAEAQPGDSVGTVDASCVAQAPQQVIDKVTAVKSPTKVAGSLAPAPAKKVKATVRVTATSRVTPAGTVTAKVYRGKKLVASRAATLSGGAATATFPKPTRKGTYKVVLTYAGSKALLGSTATRTFRIR